MLNIIFNRGTKDIEDKNYVFSPDTYFKYNYEEEWFEDELVKKMVLDVDSSSVISAHCNRQSSTWRDRAGKAVRWRESAHNHVSRARPYCECVLLRK